MVTHRSNGYQPDMFDPTHDVIDGGEGGAAAERHVRVAAVSIYEAGQSGPDLTEQEDRAFWLYYQHLWEEENACPEDSTEPQGSVISSPRTAKAGRLSKSKAASAAKERA